MPIQNTPNLDLPYGSIYESSGGCQCCCPNCPYGVGTQDNLIEGYARKIIQTCKACGTIYFSLEIANVPHTTAQEL